MPQLTCAICSKMLVMKDYDTKGKPLLIDDEQVCKDCFIEYNEGGNK
jgi:hypothetical protein